MTDFIRRTVTGAFIVIFVLGGIWLHPISFILVGALMLAGTQYEYYSMVRNAGIRPHLITGMIAGLLVYAISTLIAMNRSKPEAYLIILPVVLIVMLTELNRKEERPFDSLAHTFFPLVYTVLPVSLFPFAAFGRSGIEPLVQMDGTAFSPGILIGFMLLLWTNDVGAYLTGSVAGRHRLLERISPKKTWEGFFGGLILTMAVSFLIGKWVGMVGRPGWIIIALIISVAGTTGDLAESMLKRSLGLKDSGSVMPGHGGFLDRFDSLVVAFPLVYLYITFAA